eukprot:1688187-Amphidinium_carterae.1
MLCWVRDVVGFVWGGTSAFWFGNQGSEARYELDLAERFRSGKIMDNETEELITSFEKSFRKAAEQWKLRWLVLRAGTCKPAYSLQRPVEA